MLDQFPDDEGNWQLKDALKLPCIAPIVCERGIPAVSAKWLALQSQAGFVIFKERQQLIQQYGFFEDEGMQYSIYTAC
jgi:hypothetical protein